MNLKKMLEMQPKFFKFGKIKLTPPSKELTNNFTMSKLGLKVILKHELDFPSLRVDMFSDKLSIVTFELKSHNT